MKKEKIVLHIKTNQTELPNKLHLEIQKKNPMRIFRDRTKYTRKMKHKGQTESD